MSQMSTSQPPQIKSRLGAILRATSGNFLEQFDFFLFGFYAPLIAKAFFPSHDEAAALLNTFGVFWLGALMRPVGAVVLGAYIDRIGRRLGLIVTLAIMAMGTIIIAFCPTYATIGVAAPIIVLIGRLLQGFSAGVELGGVSVYLAEIATPGNRGFYTSFQSSSQQVAIFVAATIGYILNQTMPAATIEEWGWRIPFFIGCLIIPVIFVLRRTLEETPAFLSMKKHPTTSEVFTSAAVNWKHHRAWNDAGGDDHRDLLLRDRLYAFLRQGAAPLGPGQPAGHPDGRGHQFHLESGRRCVVRPYRPKAGVDGDCGPVFRDRLSRAAWLTAAPTFGKMLAVGMMFSLYFGVYSGTMLGALVEIVPAHVRTTCFSLAFALAAALFGTFTPFAALKLTALTGDKAAPAYWLMCAAASGFIAAVVIYRSGAIEARERAVAAQTGVRQPGLAFAGPALISMQTTITTPAWPI